MNFWIIFEKFLVKNFKIARNMIVHGSYMEFKVSMYLMLVGRTWFSPFSIPPDCSINVVLFPQTPGLHLPTSRERADSINKVFTDKISGAFAKNANVVAFDFFTSCNLIDLAIGTNIQKHFNNTNYLIIDISEWRATHFRIKHLPNM